MAWAPEALEIAAEFKRKAYFICSFDMVPISEMGQKEHLRAPEEIRLSGGPNSFRPVIVSVRLNPASPYRVEADEGSLVLKADGRSLRRSNCRNRPNITGGHWQAGNRLRISHRRLSGDTFCT